MSNFNEFKNKFEDLDINAIGIDNPFLLKLLEDFFNSNPSKCFIDKKFFYSFKDSITHIESINELNDFNISVFEHQYDFFMKILPPTRTSIFKDFYIFLLDNPEYTDGITYLDGIDKVMLSRPDFIKVYGEGFRLVAYNPNEPFPKYDKWLIMPNGFEYKSTTIHAEKYVKLDFTTLKYIQYKDFLKRWFWEEDVSVNVKAREVKNIIVFLNFLYDIRKNNNSQSFTGNFNDLYISVEEIFTYMNHIMATYNKATTRNHYIYPTGKFLRFLNENKLAEIEPACFVHLVHRYKPTPKGGEDIPYDDLIMLESHLREKASKSYLHTLYYTVFHLALSTEFRISQIVNLQIDCVHETMKEGQYLIKSNTKVSNGEVVEQHISSYTKRHLDTIIEYTQDVRNSCTNDYLSKFIFLKHERTTIYKIITETSFNQYLSKSCEEIGLKKYYSGNLRDTYMTTATEYALKNGLSMIQLSSLTKHKNIDTTNNNYVGEQIRDYLEATHSIIIGNVDIKGTIIKSLDKEIPKENIVDDGCGYCNKECCDLFSNLDCPMCNGFIVTLDRIPYYEEKIAKIDNDISSEVIKHEKEHLQTLKRLYLAYLEKLYQLKSELEVLK